MSLHHFPYQAINGAWHTVYRNHRNELVSICDTPTRAAALAVAASANREQAKQKTAPPLDPFDRRIPTGFYQDAEAS